SARVCAVANTVRKPASAPWVSGALPGICTGVFTSGVRIRMTKSGDAAPTIAVAVSAPEELVRASARPASDGPTNVATESVAQATTFAAVSPSDVRARLGISAARAGDETMPIAV